MKPPWEVEVERILSERAQQQAAAGCRPLSPRDLVDAVSHACGVDRDELVSSSRQRGVVRARELLSVTAHEWCGASYPEIAKLLGRRNHSTVHGAASRFGRRPESHRQEALGRVQAALPSNLDPPRRVAEFSRHGRGG